jgi:AraC family ethanolamine operon transcriptional activator
MTARQRLRCFDPQVLDTAVHGAQLEHRQLEAGAFEGVLSSRAIDAVIVNAGRYSRGLRVFGSLPADSVVVGAILSAKSDGCLNGYRFGRGDIICYPAGTELDYLLPAETHWVALQVPVAELSEWGLTSALFSTTRIFSASLPGCSRAVAALARLADGNGTGERGSGGREVLDPLIDELAALAAAGAPALARPSYAERMRQLRRFEQLANERIGERLSIPALCEEIGVAQRTLEQGFRDHLGLSPRRYLTVLRLHAARRALLLDSDLPVATLARRCGINHPGRFACDYRTLFGELPTETGRD